MPGQAITYTVSVHNSGPTGSSGVVISDTLPVSVTFVTANTTNGSSYNPNTGLWNVSNVGDTDVTLTLVVSANAVAGESFINTAVLIASTPPDPDSGNNTSSAPVTMRSDRLFIYLPLIFKNAVP